MTAEPAPSVSPAPAPSGPALIVSHMAVSYTHLTLPTILLV